MAGLEVLFASAAPAITCAQDALVCFLHWEVVTHGYYALGAGDQVRPRSGFGARVQGVKCRLPGPKHLAFLPPPSSEPGAHDTMGGAVRGLVRCSTDCPSTQAKIVWTETGAAPLRTPHPPEAH